MTKMWKNLYKSLRESMWENCVEVLHKGGFWTKNGGLVWKDWSFTRKVHIFYHWIYTGILDDSSLIDEGFTHFPHSLLLQQLNIL